MSMKALVLHGIDDLRYEEVPVPEIADDEVLLKVRASGICGSDVSRVFTKGTYHFPTIPGHEFSGEVVRVNTGDESLLGGRYAVFPLLPCFKCRACMDGEYQQCENYDYYGSRRDGAFAEYLAVKKWNLVPVPDTVSYEEAAMTEPCAVALHALRRFGGMPREMHYRMDRAVCDGTPGNIAGGIYDGTSGGMAGTTVVIFGAGPIGVIAAQIALAWGNAAEVVLFDIDKTKLNFAKSIGFMHVVDSSEKNPADYINELTGGAGADICLEAAGVSATAEAALKTAGRSGSVIFMGNPAGDMTFSQKGYWEILRKQLTIKGTWNSSYMSDSVCGDADAIVSVQESESNPMPLMDCGTCGAEVASSASGCVNAGDDDWTLALELIGSGAIDLKPLITHRFPFADGAHAFSLAADPSEFSVKIMFVNENDV